MNFNISIPIHCYRTGTNELCLLLLYQRFLNQYLVSIKFLLKMFQRCLSVFILFVFQRFGVKQKEKIASFKTSVDVLTLSATPIPRTLYLALTGFRDAR